MQLTGKWLGKPETQAVCAVLTGAGYRAFFVGGCVRDTLMGVPVSDIDISTDARPEQVMALARSAGLRAVPTGLDHGTVTIVAKRHAYEITTFRKDISTDGRHAVVAFSDSMAEDARRRDFTINALYADPTGKVDDPVNGLRDLRARRIRFIGDAAARIREDHLRILRFFRFNAWYGRPKGGFDRKAMAAISAGLDGLDNLSRERVGSELIRLLSARDPARALVAMAKSGVLTRILPGADPAIIGPLVYVEDEAGITPDPVLRLAALGGDGADERLRLSKAQTRELAFFQLELGAPRTPREIGYRHGPDRSEKLLALRAAVMREHVDRKAFAEMEEGAAAVFPLTAADLMPAFEGPALGKKLRAMEMLWIASGFKLSRADLLAHV